MNKASYMLLILVILMGLVDGVSTKLQWNNIQQLRNAASVQNITMEQEDTTK